MGAFGFGVFVFFGVGFGVGGFFWVVDLEVLAGLFSAELER